MWAAILDAAVATGTLGLAGMAYCQIETAERYRWEERENRRQSVYCQVTILRELLRDLPGPEDRPQDNTVEVLWTSEDLRRLESTAAKVSRDYLDDVQRATRSLRRLLELITTAQEEAQGRWYGRGPVGKVPWNDVYWSSAPRGKPWPDAYKEANLALDSLERAAESGGAPPNLLCASLPLVGKPISQSLSVTTNAT